MVTEIRVRPDIIAFAAHALLGAREKESPFSVNVRKNNFFLLELLAGPLIPVFAA